MSFYNIEGNPLIRGKSVDMMGRFDLTTDVGAIAIVMRELGFLPPVGSVSPYAGTAAPMGFLLCDGSEVSRDTFRSLFYIIGETYGPGDGSNTFNLPNLVGKVVVARDPTDPDFNILGETGGTGYHTLTINEMPVHNHTGFTSFTGSHNHTGLTSLTGAHNHTGLTSLTGAHNHTGLTDVGGNHNHGGTTSTNGNHNHVYQDAYFAENFGGGQNNLFGTTAGTDTDNSFYYRTQAGGWSRDPSDINTSTNGNHNHSITDSGTHQHGIQTDGTHQHEIQTDGAHQHGIQTDGLHRHIIDNQGGGQRHNNLQPYMVLNYIIKY
jgi:microcystin-dependent protein